MLLFSEQEFRNAETARPPHITPAPRRLFFITIALTAAYICGIYLWTPLPFTGDMVKDDVYYYLEIAKNLAGGQGPTFDSIHRTNGFHPVWQYLEVPFFYFIQGSNETLLRTILIFQTLFVAAAGILLFRLLESIFDSRIALIGGLAFSFVVLLSAANGMESGVLISFMILLIYAGLRWKVFEAFTPVKGLLFGVVLGLIFLSRLDHVFHIFSAFTVFGVYIRMSGNRGEAFRHIFWIVLGSGIIVSPYLLSNLLMTGSIFPISGALKSTFPQISLSDQTLQRIGITKYLSTALAVIYIAYSLFHLRKMKSWKFPRRYFRICVLALAAGNTLHLLYTLLFMYSGVYSWYFVAQLLFVALFLAEFSAWLLERLPPAKMNLAFLSITSLLIIGGAANLFGKTVEFYNKSAAAEYPLYHTAVWAREQTADSSVFAVQDAGMFGYISERNTVNMDGLVNTMEFQIALRDEKLLGYLKANGVDYVVRNSVSGRDSLQSGYTEYPATFWSLKFHKNSDALPLKPEYEVYRSPVIPTVSGGTKCVVVWDLNPLYSKP